MTHNDLPSFYFKYASTYGSKTYTVLVFRYLLQPCLIHLFGQNRFSISKMKIRNQFCQITIYRSTPQESKNYALLTIHYSSPIKKILAEKQHLKSLIFRKGKLKMHLHNKVIWKKTQRLWWIEGNSLFLCGSLNDWCFSK